MGMLAIATLLCHGRTREDKRQEATALLALPVNYAIRFPEQQDVRKQSSPRACRPRHGYGIFWYNETIIASAGYVLGTLMHRMEEPADIAEAHSSFHRRCD